MLRRQVTFGHGPFTFNEHLTATGGVDQTKIHDTVVLDRRENPTSFRDLIDPYHLGQGASLGRVHKGPTQIVLYGRIQVPDTTQPQKLHDREQDLRAAFDPSLCYRDSPATDGAYTLDFYEPTTDTTTYTSGWIPLRYYCRPNRAPAFQETIAERGSRSFSLSLVAGDPRSYAQTGSSLVLSSGTASGTLTNKGTTDAPLRVTIAMSGSGASNFTLSNGTTSFVLDLSSLTASSHTIVAVMETCGPYGEGRLVTKDGTRAASLKTSGPTTWLSVPVGTTTFSVSNLTGVTTVTLATVSAWA